MLLTAGRGASRGLWGITEKLLYCLAVLGLLLLLQWSAAVDDCSGLHDISPVLISSSSSSTIWRRLDMHASSRDLGQLYEAQSIKHNAPCLHR
jgi:hypothetical protein